MTGASPSCPRKRESSRRSPACSGPMTCSMPALVRHDGSPPRHARESGNPVEQAPLVAGQRIDWMPELDRHDGRLSSLPRLRESSRRSPACSGPMTCAMPALVRHDRSPPRHSRESGNPVEQAPLVAGQRIDWMPELVRHDGSPRRHSRECRNPVEEEQQAPLVAGQWLDRMPEFVRHDGYLSSGNALVSKRSLSTRSVRGWCDPARPPRGRSEAVARPLPR